MVKMGKTLFFSDFHGNDPSEVIERELAFGGVEKLICLGDYDTPEVLRAIKKLVVPKILLTGNHEFHYFFDLPIGSPNMKHPFEHYVRLWENSENSLERESLEKKIDEGGASSGLIVQDSFLGETIVYTHAGIVDVGSPDSDAPGFIWSTMRDFGVMDRNFKAMKKNQYWLMFRGHDHLHSAISFPSQSSWDSIPSYEPDKIELSKDRLYILTIGAFIGRGYGVLDSDKKTFEYRRAE